MKKKANRIVGIGRFFFLYAGRILRSRADCFDLFLFYSVHIIVALPRENDLAISTSSF